MNNKDSFIYVALVFAIILILDEKNVYTLTDSLRSIFTSIMWTMWGMYWGIEWVLKDIKRNKPEQKKNT